MIIIPLCGYCKHYTGLKDGWIMTCKAFPDGIPTDFYGDKKKCDGYIHFELKEGEKLPFQ